MKSGLLTQLVPLFTRTDWLKRQIGLLGMCLACTPLLIASPQEDLVQQVKEQSQFAFAFYHQANPSHGDFLFSPYSVISGLSMLYLGARGETQSQMQRALRLDVDPKNVAKTATLLQDSLTPQPGTKHSYQLINANSLWVDQGTFLLTDFRYAIEKQFKSALNKTSFARKQKALTTINQWVSDKTDHHIPQILSEGDINELTRLLLVNALYFQGNWEHPFDPSKTQDWPFHPTPETSISIKMMQQTDTLPFYENELIQMLALPFQGKTVKGGDLAFLIILPKSAENLDLVGNELDNEMFNWMLSLRPTPIDLRIPRFIQNTRLKLNPILKDLGMENAFDSDADFTGIDGMRDLFLSTALHEAYFSLNEQGILATAATAVAVGLKSTPPKEEPILFYADHPFFYFISDLKSQQLLFMGCLHQPQLTALIPRKSSKEKDPFGFHSSCNSPTTEDNLPPETNRNEFNKDITQKMIQQESSPERASSS